MAVGVYGFRPSRGHVVPSRSPSDGWMDLGRWRGGSPFGWAHVALQVDAGFFSGLDAGEFLLAVRTEGPDVERPFGRAVRVVVGVCEPGRGSSPCVYLPSPRSRRRFRSSRRSRSSVGISPVVTAPLFRSQKRPSRMLFVDVRVVNDPLPPLCCLISNLPSLRSSNTILFCGLSSSSFLAMLLLFLRMFTPLSRSGS